MLKQLLLKVVLATVFSLIFSTYAMALAPVKEYFVDLKKGIYLTISVEEIRPALDQPVTGVILRHVVIKDAELVTMNWIYSSENFEDFSEVVYNPENSYLSFKINLKKPIRDLISPKDVIWPAGEQKITLNMTHALVKINNERTKKANVHPIFTMTSLMNRFFAEAVSWVANEQQPRRVHFEPGYEKIDLGRVDSKIKEFKLSYEEKGPAEIILVVEFLPNGQFIIRDLLDRYDNYEYRLFSNVDPKIRFDKKTKELIIEVGDLHKLTVSNLQSGNEVVRMSYTKFWRNQSGKAEQRNLTLAQLLDFRQASTSSGLSAPLYNRIRNRQFSLCPTFGWMVGKAYKLHVLTSSYSDLSCTMPDNNDDDGF